VASFITRVLIVLSASLGMAMMDLGAQAYASFIVAVWLPSQIDRDSGGEDASRPADLWRDQFAWSQPSGDYTNLHWAHIGIGNSSSGGVSSSPRSSTGSSPEPFDSVPVAKFIRSNLVTRLHRPEGPSLPVLLTAAIFEPPRSER
jgi:hypothetical protein